MRLRLYDKGLVLNGVMMKKFALRVLVRFERKFVLFTVEFGLKKWMF